LKRPAVLSVICQPKRIREITFGGFEPLPPRTLPRDALEGLFAHRRLQNKSGQSPSLGPRCNKLIKPTAECFYHDSLPALALEFRKDRFSSRSHIVSNACPDRDQRYWNGQDSEDEKNVQGAFPHRNFGGKQFAFLARE